MAIRVSQSLLLHILLCVLLLSLLVVIFLDQLAVHRLRSLAELRETIRGVSYARTGHRCRRVNDTHVQCLPNVYLIGASKSGTTALTHMLRALPHVHFERRHVSVSVSPSVSVSEGVSERESVRVRVSERDSVGESVSERGGVRVSNGVRAKRERRTHTEVHLFDRPAFGRSSRLLHLAVQWAAAPLVPFARPVSRSLQKDAFRDTHRDALSSEAHTDAHSDTEREGDAPDVVLHYTPHYLYAPSVPFELRSLSPAPHELRFLVLLREPLARAWSSYWFKRSALFNEAGDGGSVKDFLATARAQRTEREEMERCFQREMPFYRQNHSSYHRVGNNIKGDGESYAQFFGRWRDEFFDCSACANRRKSGKYNKEDDLIKRDFSCPCCRLRITQAYTETKADIKTDTLRNDVFQALRRCFGDAHFRSAKLGLRHVDKSLYAEQALRWLLNFSPSQFLFISHSALAQRPRETMKRVVEFLTDTHTDADHKTEVERVSVREMRDEMLSALRTLPLDAHPLARPNTLSHNASLSAEDKRELTAYFAENVRLLSSMLAPCERSMHEEGER